jgi:hypothetical protein
MRQRNGIFPGLMLRSRAKRGVSKHEAATGRAALVLRDAAFGRSSG